MGKTLKAVFGLFLLQLLLGVFSGLLSVVAVLFIDIFSDTLLSLFELNSEKNKVIFLVIYSLLHAFVMALSVIRSRFGYIGYFYILFLFIAGAGALAGTLAGVLAGAGSVARAEVAVGLFVINLALGFYLGRRAIKREEEHLSVLRHGSLLFNGALGTQFAFSTLRNADFSEANLIHARFKDARMSGCCFKQVKNHHLALTTGAPIALRKVRELISSGYTDDKNFKALNLQGLEFKGLDLSYFDFSNANISFANFSGCDLQQANLSETNALATCFDHTKMTGACIQNWHIDTRTQLEGIACDYVYLKDNQQQRNPPDGKFSHNEFSKLYLQIADTVDFIAHSSEELRTEDLITSETNHSWFWL